MTAPLPRRRAVALCHVSFEDLDAIGPLLADAGYDIEMVEIPVRPDFAERARDVDLLVVLGGPIGVYEAADFPFLVDEIAVVRERLLAGRPTLGICLGSQVMAAALGARVYAGTNGKELGWKPLALTAAGADSPLRGLAGEVPVLHWHGDTFDLPEGATLLAGSDQYPHQAFAFGSHGLALQFHIEGSPAGLERWYVAHVGELAGVGMPIAKLREQALAFAPAAHAALRTMLADFLAANAAR
ncbi:glutamine amidotransferase [Derxia gummosa]|uniref:Glutamine amidotransferase n=1 Tax=Derxia gummosa DSM 723 TaxID=1121388 RepID=A0A8B6X343_9BURK|nr:glutamine amidotransferase [Derxia gummosa]